MKKHFKKLTSVMLALSLAVTMLPIYDISSTVSAATHTLQNPSKNSSGDTVWDCVWFGSYPQAEVIPSGEYTALDNNLLQDGDTIISDSLYNQLKSAAGWSANGDITISGNKYRRIQKSDATYTSSSSSHYNWSDSTTYHYFKYEPIKWRVLNVNGNDAFLLADKGLDDQMYNTSYTSVTWETATIRSWLNGYSASSNAYRTDYTGKNFIDTAFGSSEQSAIKTTAVINDDNINYGTNGGNYTNDKIFLLSESEVYTDSATSYGFDSDYREYDKARRSKSSTYSKAMGTYSNTSSDYRGNCWWWLRSPGNDTNYATYVSDDGYVGISGTNVNYNNDAVRPALHLNLSSSNLYSYAGTVCSDGTKNVEGGGIPIQPGDDTPSYEGNSLQCSSSCTVKEGEKTTVGIQAYGDTKENLQKVIDSVKWTAEDASKVKVSMTGFFMPYEPTVYKGDNGTYETWKTSGLLRIEGLKKGETTITGTASDGSRATCKVTVAAKPGSDDESGEGNGGSLVLGADASGKADGGVAQFFPDNWSAKSTIFPVEIRRKEEKNGTYKIRGTVGIGRSDWLDNETTWNKYKNNVSDAQKYTGRVNCLDSYRDTWGVKSITVVSTDKFEVLPKVSVMGYFENTYDKNGNKISSTGKIAADAKWSGSINWQFITPIGPLYLNLEGSGKLSGEIEPDYDKDKKVMNIVSGSLTLTPQVTLEGGYGIDKVAQIGAQGSLSLPITLIPATKGELTAKASLHLKLVFVIDWTKDLATYTKPLWNTTGKSKMALKNKMADSYNAITSEDGFSLMDTSFSQKTSDWNGRTSKTSSLRNKVRSANANSADVLSEDSEVTLMSGILPSSMPIQKEINGKKVMVFQSYDNTRDTLNSTVLMYSVYENGVWSEPKPVWDNGFADMYADMKVVDNKLVLAWQKEKKLISGDVDSDSEAVLKNIAENSEICFAEFDEESGTFENQTYVTDNAVYDMMPQICNDNDAVAISWVRNSEAELMQDTGDNYIYTAKWNGKTFEGEQKMLQSIGTIDHYITYSNGSDIRAVYTGEQNGIKAVFDTDNQVMDSLSDLMMFSEDGTVSSMNYDNGVIDFVSGGNIYSYDIKSEEVTKMQAGDSALGNTAVYCSNGEKSSYVWSRYNEETDMGSVVASVKTVNGYSEPVTLYEKKGTTWRYLSPVIDEKGNWSIIANALDNEKELNSVIDIARREKTDMELVGASIDEKDTKDGLTGVDYFAVNNGDKSVDSLNIKIEGKDGSVVTKEVPVTLMPGESLAGTVYLDVPKPDNQQEVSISVYTDDLENIDTVKDTVGLPDVSVIGEYKDLGDNIEVTAQVTNAGSGNSNTIVHLYSDETMEKELAVSGQTVVGAGENKEVSFVVPKSSITYNENDAAYLTLKADVSEGDMDEDNNAAYVVVYKEGDVTTETSSSDITQNVTGETTKTPDSTTKLSNNNIIKITKNTTGIKGKANKKKTRIKKIKTAKKSLKIIWKKINGITGYQIQYSTSGKFKKAKKITIKKAKITSKTIKRLKSKKKYYVRIRTYIMINGKKYYSNWSKKKSQKTK